MIEQRRQQDDFIASVLIKAKENRSNDNILVGRTRQMISANSNWKTIQVDFDYYSESSTTISCSMLRGAKESLTGKAPGQKVVVARTGSFYVVIDMVAD